MLGYATVLFPPVGKLCIARLNALGVLGGEANIPPVLVGCSEGGCSGPVYSNMRSSLEPFHFRYHHSLLVGRGKIQLRGSINHIVTNRAASHSR